MRLTIFEIPFRLTLAVVTVCLLAVLATTAFAGVDVVVLVTADPGKIMDGDKVLAEVPKGTRLELVKEHLGWAEVKVPNTGKTGSILGTQYELVKLEAKPEVALVLDSPKNPFNGKGELGILFDSKKPISGLTPPNPSFNGEETKPGMSAEQLEAFVKQVEKAYQPLTIQQGTNTPESNNVAKEVKPAEESTGGGWMGVVVDNPGKIMDSDKVIKEVLKGTRLWVFSQKPSWYEVKVPGSEQHGWISETSMKWIFDDVNDSQNLIDEINKQLVHGNDLANKKYFPEALEHMRKLLVKVEQHYGNDNPYTGQLYRSFAYINWELRNYQEAKTNYEQALAIFRDVFGSNHLSTAQCMGFLGTISEELGDTNAAKKYYEESLAICRKLGADSEVIVNLNKIKNIFFDLGDVPIARRMAEEVLGICLKKYGKDHAATGNAFHNLANIIRAQGDYPTAENYFTEALAIRRRVLQPDDCRIAHSLCDFGCLCLQQGDLDKAKILLSEALTIFRKGTDKENMINALRNLGSMEMDLENFTSAKHHFDEASELTLRIFGKDHERTAHALECQGALAEHTKEYPTAWLRYEEALRILRLKFGKEHPNTTYAQEALAKLAIAEEDFDSAQRRLDEVRRIERRYAQYILPSLSAAEQLLYLEMNFSPDWLQSLSFASLSVKDTSVANASAAWLINGKAIAHEALAERELLSRDLANPQLAPLVRELQDIRAQLATLSLSAPKPSEAEAHQANLTKLGANEFQLAQKLSEANGREAIVRDWVELESVRRTIPAGSVYLDMVFVPIYDFENKKYSDPHYLVWVIPALRNGKVQLVDLGEAEAIEKAVEEARALLAIASDRGLHKEGEAVAHNDVNKKLQAVADLVLKPLLPHLADKKQLILSPDGALWLLPWAALPVAENKCLLEQCSIRYVTSGRDLLRGKSTNKLVTSASAIVVNPNYNLNGTAAKAALRALLPEVKFDETNTQSSTSRSSLPSVNALPNTSVEGHSAATSLEQLAKSKPVFYEQEQALEAVVKKFQRPKHLLLSTHGFFLPDQERKQIDEKQQLLASNDSHRSRAVALTTDGKPVENPLLRCGLLFAGCNAERMPGLDDGILTGLEIVGMDLRGTELVVLSACETGIGKVRNGEGVAGLRQAFQLAGAQSVVSTLWQVPDRDSAIIMSDFFTNLAAGQTKAEALRNAQLKRIAARKEKSGAAHPFFWAAWTVTGE